MKNVICFNEFDPCAIIRKKNPIELTPYQFETIESTCEYNIIKFTFSRCTHFFPSYKFILIWSHIVFGMFTLKLACYCNRLIKLRAPIDECNVALKTCHFCS